MAPANPYRKSMSVPKPKPAPKPRHGIAQAEFIEETRREIDTDVQFFQKNDWTQITRSRRRGTALTSKKRLMANDFYVKDIAAWVPHLITPHYVPSCARCLEKENVDLSKTEWVENPKVLHGTFAHRHLDTKCCYCNKCESSFTGWHDNVIKKDSNEVTGILNYRLSKGFAVDEELHSFIVNHSMMTTAAIHQRLKHMLADNWLADCAFCYRAAMADRVQGRNVNAINGTNCRRLEDLLVAMPNLTRSQKRIQSLRFDLKMVERELRTKEAAFNGDVEFASIFRKKKNRNSINEAFPGIGRAKCLTLIQNNVLSAKELLEHDGNNPAILYRWKETVQAHCDDLSQTIAHLRTKKTKISEDLALEELMEEDTVEPTTTRTPAPTSKPPPFSSLLDSHHYNGRCISKATVDRINATDFQRRKSIQLAKMRNIKAEVLKLDWSYKLPPKIKVHAGRGKAFAPFKSHLSVQNEDALTVFWKFYSGGESIDVAAADLKNLRERQRIHGVTVKVTYVDNCCTVRNKLTSIFPGVLVKLDNFHWFVRWDDCLCDLKSESTSVFRGLMRRAVFLTENSELHRATEFLKKKYKRQPTTKEVFKCAKAIVPPPEELERRVMAVIHTLMDKDSEADRAATTRGDSEQEAATLRFFKRGSITLHTIFRQLKHIRRGCLSDPHHSVVQIHRENPTTGEVRTARSTGTNEVDNRCLNRLLDTPSIGLPRADRVIHNYYEESNDRKFVNRLGQSQGEAKRLEQLQALHGVATACGFQRDEMPFAKDSYPRDLDALVEHIGFEHCLPCSFNEPVTDTVGDDPSATDELRDFLQDIEFDDFDDVPIDPSQFEPADGDNVVDNSVLDPDPFGFDAQVDLSIYMPSIIESEKTCDAYVRLTQGQPWIPFKDVAEEATFSALDKAELKLWKEMSIECDRNSKTIDGPRGYKTFAVEWDRLVANMHKKKLNGEDVVTINRKSYSQLQDQCDRLKRQKELLELNQRTDPAVQRMEDVFRSTRRQLPPHQSTATCQAQEHSQVGTPMFGIPFALNPTVAVTAFQQNDNTFGAPILFRRPTTHAQRQKPKSRQSLGSLFKAKLHCWQCGFQRKDHCPPAFPFGDKCINNLGYEHCSKCIERVELHGNSGIGPWCTRPAGSSSKYNDWWKHA